MKNTQEYYRSQTKLLRKKNNSLKMFIHMLYCSLKTFKRTIYDLRIENAQKIHVLKKYT